MKTKNWKDLFRAARRAGVPLVAINTPDPASTIREIATMYAEKVPMVRWDACSGVLPINELGRAVAESSGIGDSDITIGQPAMFAVKAADYPEGTIAFMHQSQSYWDNPMVVQGVWNLRDAYKIDGRTLVLLAVDHKLPAHLAQDIKVLDEPLPTDNELAKIVSDIVEASGITVDKERSGRAVEALRALSSFSAEQELAMAITKDGIDIDQLWEGKKKVIEQTKGLSFDRGTETFDDIGGLENAKDFGRQLFEGPHPPAVVVRIEELEKAMAGTEGDLSGTSQDALQVFLSAMEDNNWYGQIAFGPPGSGKSLYSKALANTFNRLPLVMDLNAAKGGLVGQSEAQVRQIVKTLQAIGGSEVFFVASMNKMTIKPELMRRFRYGVWMFDLPDAKERVTIWKLQRERYSIPADDPQPDDTDWSGSDIRNLCELSWRTGRPLKEAMAFLSSNSKATPEVIKAARDAAEGKYISASRPGVYSSKKSPTVKRRVTL